MRGRGDEEEQRRQQPGAPWCLSCCNQSSINTRPPGPLISVMCALLPWRIHHNPSTCSYRTPYLSVAGIVSLEYCAELWSRTARFHLSACANYFKWNEKLEYPHRGKEITFLDWKSLLENYSYVLLNKENLLVDVWRHIYYIPHIQYTFKGWNLLFPNKTKNINILIW